MKPTIGLEIHIAAETKTKMFCSCKNNHSENKPNENVCPICLGHPGTLPTINKKAVEQVLKLGLALKGEVTKKTNFDRKSYFYPDLPKGYQISQFDNPLIKGGELIGVGITRIHLEEDAGRLLHSDEDPPSQKSSSRQSNSSLMDFNRAGVPLIELVTEPDITSSDQAVEFAKELQNILRYIGVSSADMEKGQMRVEANISWDMGTKVEVKNINSFKAVKGAIEFELKRQKELIELGKRDEIVQETRGWDGTNKKTVSQRSKESAHDYRYFPEPDLPPLDLSKWDLDKLIIDLPELPSDKKERFKKEFSLNEGSVDSLIQDKEEAGFFEEVASEFRNLSKKEDYNLLFNYFSSDLKGIMNDKKSSFSNIKITPESFAHLVFMIEEEELSSRLAKNVLVKMFETGKDPETIKNEEGMEVIGGGEKLQKIINEIIEENPDPVEDYKSGKEEALKFLLGQVMAKTKGQADPQETKEIIKKTLS